MAGLLSNQYDPSVNSDAPGDFAPTDSDLTVPRSFDDVQQILNKQAAEAVNKGANEQDILAQLKERTDQLAKVWSTYGAEAFTPKKTTPQFDPSTDNTVANAESVQGKAASNIQGLLNPPKAGIGDIMAEGNETLRQAEMPVGDVALSGLTGYTPAGMAGLLAGGVSGAGKTAWDTANFAIKKALGMDAELDPMASFTDTSRKVSEALSYEPKTAAGKAVQAPLQAIQEGSQWAGEKTLEYTGSPEAAAAVDVFGQLAPWVVAGKIAHEGIKAITPKEPLPKLDTSQFEDVNDKDKTAINVPPGGFEDTPKTGDQAIDAGIKAGNEYKGQTDLFSPQHELSQDLFQRGPEGSVPADLLERRRQAAEEASTDHEVPQRTPEEQAKLEQDYLFQQQERLNRGSQAEDLISRRGDIPEPYLGIPHAEMPQGDVNTQMHREMLQALAERGQLRNKATLVKAPEPTQGQLFEPSSNEQVPQNQIQGRMDLPTQQDLFGNTLPEGKPTPPEAPPTPAAPKKVKETAESVRARLAEKLKSVPSESVEDQTQTYNFKNWFGKSKVTDGDGKPLVVYHGTSKDKDFSAFNVGRRGTWFTTDPSEASMYAKDNDSTGPKYNPDTRRFENRNTAARVIPTYLKIENPYVMTPEDLQKAKYVENYAKWQRDFFNEKKNQGYDGVKVDDKTWVAFDPTQIKSSIGNKGTFDSRNKNIHASEQVTPSHGEILDLSDAGKLTGQHALDAVIDSVGPDSTPYQKDAAAFASHLNDLGDKFGGKNTPIHVVDMSNPEHATAVNEFLTEHPHYGDNGSHAGRWGAFYDPTRKQIFVNGERNLKPVTLIHETAHAITHAALDLGDRGELPEKQQQAYHALRNVFNELAPRLHDAAWETVPGQEPPNAWVYGLQNLHEMTAELFGNPEFRAHLKSLKLDAGAQAKLGLSRTVWGKITSMFDAVAAPVKKMLGLNKEASDGLDALFAAHDHFFNSFSDERAQVLKEHNDGTTRASESASGERKDLSGAFKLEQQLMDKIGPEQGHSMSSRSLAAEREKSKAYAKANPKDYRFDPMIDAIEKHYDNLKEMLKRADQPNTLEGKLKAKFEERTRKEDEEDIRKGEQTASNILSEWGRTARMKRYESLQVKEDFLSQRAAAMTNKELDHARYYNNLWKKLHSDDPAIREPAEALKEAYDKEMIRRMRVNGLSNGIWSDLVKKDPDRRYYQAATPEGTPPPKGRPPSPRFLPSEATDDMPVGHTPLKATITDPLSTWQKLANTTKTVLGTLRTATGPRREFMVSKEEARGAENAALMQTMRAAKGLETTMKAEGAPAAAVRSYMQPHIDDPVKQASDNAALDKYPNTKKYVDDFMKKPSTENAKVLAKLIADNPNATLKDLLMAEKIHDNPAYTMRGYQPQAYTDGLFRNAEIADKKTEAGQQLSPEEGNAKKQVDNLTNWVKENLIPTPDMRAGSAGDKNMSQLRNMAKSLGLRPAQILKGLAKEDKPSALVKAINEAVPEKDVDVAVQRLARDIAGITNSGTSIVSKYYRGARFGSILTARESVPPEIQAVWGKVQDPVSIMVQTLMKQAKGIAELKQQYEIKDKALGRWMFYSKVGAPDGYTAQLKGPKFGPLQGMWTTPDLKTMLSSQVELSTAGDRLTQALNTGNVDDAFKSLLAKSAVGLWGKGVSLYKAKRLITDPGYYIMYAAGGPSIMAIHGIVDPRYAARGLLAHIAELSPAFLKALPEGLRNTVQNDLTNTVKSGMNEFQMQGEIMDEVSARKYAEAVATGMQQDPVSVMKTLGSVLMKVRDAGMTGLSLTDGYAKRAALFQRQDVLNDFYNRQGTPKDAETVRKEAADWVKDTTITSSRTPVAARMMEKMGFSQGLIYGVETVRNGYNAIAHGMSDFARGAKANDPTMMALGLKQIAGTGLAVNYMGGLITASMSALLATMGITSQVLDPTDPQQDYLQQKGSRFEGQRPVKLEGTGDRDNTWWWAPGDRNDFYYQLSQPIHALMDSYARAQAGKEVDWEKDTKSAFGAFLGTFFNNSFPKKIMDITGIGRSNGPRAPSWTKNAPEAYEKANTFYRETLGVDSKTADGLLSFEDIFRPGVVNGFTAAKESQASTPIKVMQTLGMGAAKIGKDADLSTRTGSAVKNEFADVKRELDLSTRSEMNYSDDIITKDYAKAMQDGEKVMTKLKDAFEFAKANGKDVGDVFQAAKVGGVPDKAILQALSGNMNPASLLQGDLSAELKEKMLLYKDDPEKQQKIADIFIHRMLLVNDLSSKYQSMTPDQLKELR